MDTATVAQWKMVDEDDLLFFPTRHSVGLGIFVLVSTDGNQRERPRIGDQVG